MIHKLREMTRVALRDKNENARGNAIRIAIGMLEDDNSEVRCVAATALGQLKASQAVRPLITALQDVDKRVRRAAAKALGRIDTSQAVEPLIFTLQDSDSEVRQAAAKALGRIGASQAQDALVAATRDHDIKVRETSSEALRQIWDKKWEQRPLVRTSTDMQSDGTKPIVIDSRHSEIRDSLPEDRRTLFDDLITSLLEPRTIEDGFESAQNIEVDGLTRIASFIRYSEVSFPAHAQIHCPAALRVAIMLKPTSEDAVPLDLQAPPDFTTLKVDAYLIASPVDFDLQGPNVQTIKVPKNADSAPIIFRVIPKTLRCKTLAVEFFQDARYLGRAEVETTVEEEARTTETVSAHPALALRAQQLSPDLTIYIEEVALDKARRLYRFLLLSPLCDLNLNFEETGEIELKSEPATYFEGIFAELNEWLRQQSVNETEFFGRLNSLGASLYKQLFPEKLKRLYWEKLRDKVKSVQIISADPWIPWELVRPYHPDTLEEDDFLCERFNLTRWLAGPASPDVLNLQKMALIVDAPKHSSRAKEAADLKRLPGIDAEDIPPTLQAIYALLESRGFNGLHFACHGEYEAKNPDQSALWFEGRQPLRPNDIVGKKCTFGREKPLVFLNACETGQSGIALTGSGGWARAFVKAGAAGFLGSLWEAQDESAYRFALAFYRYLLGGKTIAEAVKLARRDIRKAGDPTWLSYTVYANPLARMELK